MATHRRRLQRQLEFYLSASNVRQDKFLQQHMNDDGFVPVSLFLSFPKLQALRATEKLVLEAAAKSEALRVDEACASIAPTVAALQDARERDSAASDARTIYVEGYDANAHDHDSLRKLFVPFGKVNFVSLPRFLPSRKFKGFAFIEFATEDAAQQALVTTQATEKPTSLNGLRAMSKGRWKDMKEKLKAQLGTTTTQHKSETIQESNVAIIQKKTPKPRDTKTTSGHVRFRDEDDLEEQPHDFKRPRPANDEQ